MGIYRSSPAGGETIAYNVKGLDLSYGASPSAANHGAPADGGTSAPIPAPAPTPEPTPAPAPTEPTGQTFVGGSANNTIYGTVGNDRAYGYAGNDLIKGAAGSDLLDGGTGDDRIYGELGNDILTGGAGKDTFFFNTALGSSNIDRITDFNVADDTIRLENAVMTKLVSTGMLSASKFRVGAKALDSDDHIVYDSQTGALSYDADGSGTRVAVQFATLAPNLKLTAADVYVI
jgi:Ca2+-binding RTX toxin-like protein